MSLNLADYQNEAREAVKAFWGNREAARRKQIESGKADQGERSGVTGGKNMDGFRGIVKSCGSASPVTRLPSLRFPQPVPRF